MADLEKEDCISFEEVLKITGVSRQTTGTYLNALGIRRIRFPFDRKTYISIKDGERLKKFVESNQ